MPPKWFWTDQKKEAARLLADFRLKQIDVANQIGVSRETIRNWNACEEFQNQIEFHKKENQLKHEQELNEQEKSRADCKTLLEKVTRVIEQITTEQLSTIANNPISAINLWLRLYNTVHNNQRRSQNDNDESDRPPNLAELEPEVAQRIMDVLARECS